MKGQGIVFFLYPLSQLKLWGILTVSNASRMMQERKGFQLYHILCFFVVVIGLDIVWLLLMCSLTSSGKVTAILTKVHLDVICKAGFLCPGLFVYVCRHAVEWFMDVTNPFLVEQFPGRKGDKFCGLAYLAFPLTVWQCP
jgi:hypothetical protein